jgi:predicted ATPase
VTYHVVIAFDRDAEGDLKPGEAREVLSPIVAERRARALALEHAGALALVNELHKALVPPRGLIASGKFEQYKRDIPYATLAQAFRSLVRPILGESETQLVRWRKSLSEALGPNGQLIVNLVPELELVIGKQPPVANLSPQDAKNRFQLVFRRFLGAFARREHPLALFLDDSQWLDAATLRSAIS